MAVRPVRRFGLAEIVGVITTVNEVYDRVAMHGVRASFSNRQITALGLPSMDKRRIQAKKPAQAKM